MHGFYWSRGWSSMELLSGFQRNNHWMILLVQTVVLVCPGHWVSILCQNPTENQACHLLILFTRHALVNRSSMSPVSISESHSEAPISQVSESLTVASIEDVFTMLCRPAAPLVSLGTTCAGELGGIAGRHGVTGDDKKRDTKGLLKCAFNFPSCLPKSPCDVLTFFL